MSPRRDLASSRKSAGNAVYRDWQCNAAHPQKGNALGAQDPDGRQIISAAPPVDALRARWRAAFICNSSSIALVECIKSAVLVAGLMACARGRLPSSLSRFPPRKRRQSSRIDIAMNPTGLHALASERAIGRFPSCLVAGATAPGVGSANHRRRYDGNPRGRTFRRRIVARRSDPAA
jgi:hypothetical protein